MTGLRFFPHQAPRNVAAAIYGLVLGSSIIAATSADHPNQPGLVEIYLCVTALIFYLAHVYAGVIGAWVEGEIPTLAAVRHELRQEWPMIWAQLLPAIPLLLGALRVIDGNVAISLALAVALSELLIAVVIACWKARATTQQAIISLIAALAFALVVTLLKIFIHS
jgi:predicted branched-subunit amino acid permease